MLLLAPHSSSSVAPTNSTGAKKWLFWTPSSAFLVLACLQCRLCTKHALSAHCLWQKRSAGMCGLPSHFGHSASGRQSLVKAILQWMRLIAHVTIMAGFSSKPPPPDQEVDPDSWTKRQTSSPWGTLFLLQSSYFVCCQG